MAGPSPSLGKPSLSLTLICTDYSVFASPDFDPNEYANAILAADSYSTSESKIGARAVTNLKGTQDSIAKEDISVAISKLTFGIEDVSKQIRNLVRDNQRVFSGPPRPDPHSHLRLQLTMKIS
jgi:hypothetical protein